MPSQAELARRPKPATPNAATPSLRIAYLVSRFPKATETFVLYELLAVEQGGHRVELFPLWRGEKEAIHPEAESVVRRARYARYLSLALLASHWYYLTHTPATYVRTLCRLLWENLGSMRYFCGALALFPKAVHFARSIERERIGHVHAHFASHPAAAAYVIGRLAEVSYSFTAHGSDLHRDRHMLREKVARARFVVAISDYNRRVILEACGRTFGNKVIVLRCGTDLDRFAPTARQAENRSRPISLVCVGTLHEVKGQTYLIEACRLLRQQGVPLRCTFVGDGPDHARLRAQIAASGLDDVVVLAGRQTRDEIIEVLRNADIAVAPSVPTRDGRREGIPVALMEAMACGLAVVASDLSGIPELVEHERTGLLTPPGDAVKLAEAIRRLCRDGCLRVELGDEARRKVETHYDLRRNAHSLTELLATELATEGRR